jgi:hypothetical protein
MSRSNLLNADSLWNIGASNLNSDVPPGKRENRARSSRRDNHETQSTHGVFGSRMSLRCIPIKMLSSKTEMVTVETWE